MVTLHEVITFIDSMQISISSLQTHNVNRCGRSRHLASFFFSSRRRHTRLVSDWSSDVCSSDLAIGAITTQTHDAVHALGAHLRCRAYRIALVRRSQERRVGKECRSRWSPEHHKKKAH